MMPRKPACVHAVDGEAASQQLGRPASAAVLAHRAVCTACELERLAFESLDEHAAEPSAELRAWVRAVARRPSR